MEPVPLFLAFAGLAIGGLLKGATGAGAPVVAIPILALLYDVPFAVTVFVVPNVLSNIWQSWAYRRQGLPRRFVARFALAGGAGVAVGTVMLATLAPEALLLVVAVAVLAYIGFRIFRPGWTLPYRAAERIALPVGTLAGILQGASGVSAPVSITFLNAMRLERAQFIATISVFFLTMAVLQIPFLAGFGFLTWERIALGLVALVPLVGFMPVGAWLARHVSRAAFDRVILGLLAVIAVKLIADAL